MTDKVFEAVLAKNAIARTIRDYKDDMPEEVDSHYLGYIPTEYIIERLKEIELVIGTANQPSVDAIINSERNDI